MTKRQADNEYKRAVELIERLSDKAYNVRFSDIIHQPAATLLGICNFLGLDFEERMLTGVEYNFVYPNTTLLKEKAKKE